MAAKIMVFSLSDLVTICYVGCPLREMTLHFLGSWGTTDPSVFPITSGLSSSPKSLTALSSMSNQWYEWLIVKGFFVAF